MYVYSPDGSKNTCATSSPDPKTAWAIILLLLDLPKRVFPKFASRCAAVGSPTMSRGSIKMGTFIGLPGEGVSVYLSTPTSTGLPQRTKELINVVRSWSLGT